MNARKLAERSPALGAAAKRAARVARTMAGYRAALEATSGTRSVADAPPSAYVAILRRLAGGCDSVLDIGTGLMDSLALFPCRIKIGVDAHRPYLEHRHVREAIPIHADALRLAELFVPGAVDLVTMIDVIEHFDADDARDLLRHVETIAARRIVIATPRGHFPQEGYDAFGLGGEWYQRHRSEWDVEQFTTLGYRVVVLRGHHDRRNESFVRAFGPDAPPVDSLVAWKDVAQPSRE